MDGKELDADDGALVIDGLELGLLDGDVDTEGASVTMFAGSNDG